MQQHSTCISKESTGETKNYVTQNYWVKLVVNATIANSKLVNITKKNNNKKLINKKKTNKKKLKCAYSDSKKFIWSMGLVLVVEVNGKTKKNQN